MQDEIGVPIAPDACYSCEYSDRCPFAYILIGECFAYEAHRLEGEEKEDPDDEMA